MAETGNDDLFVYVGFFLNLFLLLSSLAGYGMTRSYVCLLQSGAKINISDGSCPERIVTVTGSIETIFKAFTLISKKFEEVKEVFHAAVVFTMTDKAIN